MAEELLKVENLSIDYKIEGGYLSAVNDVSFSIEPGQVMALVGESGCGKSTIAHTVMRLSIDHNEKIGGHIYFQGRDLLALSEPDMEKVRGKEIGMIFQNPLDSLNPVYRAGTQVEEGLKLDGISREEAKQRVLELFKDVQIPNPETRMESFPHELSGGMRQRVMIAMMLAREPKLLIADEPTTALDVTVEAQVLRIMKDMCEKEHAAVLLITHNFGIVAEIADRVGIMYAGELVEEGEIHEIFRQPIHPYSQALLSALPRMKKSQGRIQAIEGNVPRITEKEDVCRFANRCPYAEAICREKRPERREVVPGHWVCCHVK